MCPDILFGHLLEGRLNHNSILIESVHPLDSYVEHWDARHQHPRHPIQPLNHWIRRPNRCSSPNPQSKMAPTVFQWREYDKCDGFQTLSTINMLSFCSSKQSSMASSIGFHLHPLNKGSTSITQHCHTCASHRTS